MSWLSLGELSTLVCMSARFSDDLKHLNLIIAFSTYSRIHQYLTATCFAFLLSSATSSTLLVASLSLQIVIDGRSSSAVCNFPNWISRNKTLRRRVVLGHEDIPSSYSRVALRTLVVHYFNTTQIKT
eukprot:TRINITY_DN8843_c0_g5_i1.p1 TRINITY_DN8843_c0_g5~~TRINITY_DN8843_c0_g5_i1.p1  ORF type:complete len:127 (+),score=10.07 TRINITY_DN8843_c0_g5_i1:308-688(+)